MNILLLTLDFPAIDEHGIYTDLMRVFLKNGHKVYIISPIEKRNNQPTRLISKENYKLLKLRIGNTTQTNIIEKGISTLTLESKYKRGIDKYFPDIKFDLVLYSTPPVTLLKAVAYAKRRDNAKTYLLLKDIFPQNALDLGMLKNKGISKLLYKYFRAKEKELYRIADYIGCMSHANVDYLLGHNKEISNKVIEVCPNSIEPRPIEKDGDQLRATRDKYHIPYDKTVFVYGGSFGKPQGIDFLINCLQANQNSEKAYFIVVGAGTEFKKIKAYFDTEKPGNAQLLSLLSKEDFAVLLNACDAGLIFLDHRFTIPNFPSRLLDYMQACVPVLAATDVNTDIGKIIEGGNFGLWCQSGNVDAFSLKLQQLCDEKLRRTMGENARKYLDENYTVDHSYEIIMKHFRQAGMDSEYAQNE